MNKVTICGYLTRDVEMRFTQSGTQVARFTIAVNRALSKEKKAQAIAQNQPTTDFISCTAWGKQAELIANYHSKGSQILIAGRIQTGSYEKEGQRVYTTDVIVEEFDFLSVNKQENTQQAGNIDGFFPVDNDDIPF